MTTGPGRAGPAGGTVFDRIVRPALFRLGGGDAETAHEWTLRRLATLSRRPAALAVLGARYAVAAPRTVFGVDFPNPVGLAAGMDKDGAALPAWPALGFGFVEVGTVTAHAQPGNPRPRLFRLPDSAAVINRMGFNNAGAAALAARLAALERPLGVPLGISLGKSKVTELDDAVQDYLASYRMLHPYGDYFAVNVSSPNTPGLRALQDRGHLDALLAALVGEKPILVKIAPDLTEAAIAEVLEVCLSRGAAGVIATNTTLGRDGLAPADRSRAGEAGGLSGRPLTERTRRVVSFVHAETGGALPVIGVGGILDPSDATALLDAGASLVQLYTGFVYGGPGLVRAVARATRR
ncbi:quinone-dependent dihydroorotate dehydrogenase [Plantactinospora sp. S1510]|uniref:Dihydroorotate dehydrogenase (quinone) n=1 Tax=Plantactinospora alkalitolerans TaxID=2789879 RepID=A0ABS0GSM0_9ACTN|nr:quinone-dependent dihydroorotate dehydrogenase [Plantactinospora alkalitolerans]MBF9128993.1 quinone-dependent dihydroorotate dehydrogenase [Plantactinospora alkalitolerans]